MGAPALPQCDDRSFVPYPLDADPKFEKCLPLVLVQEGGHSNDAHDPGGMTMYGIIQKEYDAKRRQWGLANALGLRASLSTMRMSSAE